MLHQFLRITGAAMFALLCMVVAVLVLALAVGQSLDAVAGAWQIVPLVGEIAVLLAVVVFAFRRAYRWY